MNWLAKALIQQVFSHLPGGEGLNYYAQTKVLKNLPVSDALFAEKVEEAKRHFTAFKKYCKTDNIDSPVFYEFGAGWDMLMPLAYYLMGVESQVLTDISALIKPELIDHSLMRLYVRSEELDLPKDRLDKLSKPIGEQALTNLKERFKIEYQAPVDARNTSLEGTQFDAITSTNTMEHIPARDIPSILKECHRLLKPGGLYICRIDYQDHYAYTDPSISVYNYLKFSKGAWAILNPDLQPQNRLRHRDYLGMIQQSPFDLVEDRHYEPTEEDLSTIEHLKPHADFVSKFSVEEMAVRWSYLVLRK